MAHEGLAGLDRLPAHGAGRVEHEDQFARRDIRLNRRGRRLDHQAEIAAIGVLVGQQAGLDAG